MIIEFANNKLFKLKSNQIFNFVLFREHGRAGINIRKYRCKICLKEFPWSGVSISKHVKQAHFLSLEKYSNLYEANSTIESLINEMMNPVVTAIKTEKEQSGTNLSVSLGTSEKMVFKKTVYQYSRNHFYPLFKIWSAPWMFIWTRHFILCLIFLNIGM